MAVNLLPQQAPGDLLKLMNIKTNKNNILFIFYLL